MELISVIVPVYNTEAYLEKCLNSIVNQTYPNLEIIVINDCSIDNSGAICRKFQYEYGNIKYLELKENRGVSHARNLGLAYASGTLIGFVDSDDWAEKDMFQTLYQTLTANNVSMVSANYKLINHDTQKEENSTAKHSKDIYIDNVLDVLLYIISNFDIVLWNKLYRREVFKGIVFSEGKVYEDVDVVHMLVENAGCFATSTKYLYNYHLQPESITRDKKIPVKFFEHLYAVINRYEYLTNKYNSKELEQLCRQHIYRTVMRIVDSLNHINIASDERISCEFEKAKNIVYGTYSYDNCGFDDAEKKLIASLERNIIHYKISRDLLKA